ncbi:MAG: hypothetical protein ACPG6B_05995 [Oceanihabitans sp.]
MVAQTIELNGKIESEDDVENIHIINSTQQKFTITTKDGAFIIPAQKGDTLVISSIQNKLKTHVVKQVDVLLKTVTITLKTHVNQLDEVVIGSFLTGDLTKDMQGVIGKPITAKSLGIPSYQGPLLTQNQRKLKEASDFKPKAGGSLGGAGGSVGLIPLLNAITGRTKKLKRIVKLDQKEALMQAVKQRLSKELFANNPLPENKKMDYFYFVSDDANFTTICTNKSDLEILVFLKEKLKRYKNNAKLIEN